MNVKYDAHVKARHALLRRIVARRYEWGIPPSLRREAALSEPLSSDRHEDALRTVLMADAARRLAAYQWPRHDWGVKYGRYYPIGGAAIVGRYVDVPAAIIHSIMCTEVSK